MSAALTIATQTATLPALVDRASKALSGARSAAEVLEARDMAAYAYDAAKRTARLAKAKQAHDELIAAAMRAQADALEIDANAKRRLADEYDAAQERGEIAKVGKPQIVPNGNNKATAADLGIPRKTVMEGRELNDAEKAEPGIVRKTVDEAVAKGEEPTKAKVRRAVKKAAKRRPKPRPAIVETAHDRDLRALLGMWEASCETARVAFLKIVANPEK